MKNLSLVMLCLLLLCSCKQEPNGEMTVSAPAAVESPPAVSDPTNGESPPAVSVEESYGEDIDCELYENPPFRAGSLEEFLAFLDVGGEIEGDFPYSANGTLPIPHTGLWSEEEAMQNFLELLALRGAFPIPAFDEDTVFHTITIENYSGNVYFTGSSLKVEIQLLSQEAEELSIKQLAHLAPVSFSFEDERFGECYRLGSSLLFKAYGCFIQVYDPALESASAEERKQWLARFSLTPYTPAYLQEEA